MKKYIILSLLMILLGMSACEKTLIGPTAPNNPEQNFETLWQEYDRLSALISVKNLDWKAIYAQYRPQVTPTTTDAELFKVLSEMLDHLDDSHLTMLAPGKNPMRYDGGLAGKLTHDDFSLNIVKESYLTDIKEYGENFVYGKLSNQLGYIHLKHCDFDQAYYEKALNKILGDLQTVDSLVLDLRDFEGGLDKNAAYIAGRFATTRSLFMTSRKRSGPNYQDFTPPVSWYVQPVGQEPYMKPVVVLTNRWTASSGEILVWALKAAKPITQVGDTTLGCYSDQARRELPNGWYYTISVNDIRATDGKSYEGIGIAPDILVENLKSEILTGKDRALEKAIQAID